MSLFQFSINVYGKWKLFDVVGSHENYLKQCLSNCLFFWNLLEAVQDGKLFDADWCLYSIFYSCYGYKGELDTTLRYFSFFCRHFFSFFHTTFLLFILFTFKQTKYIYDDLVSKENINNDTSVF